MNLMKWRAKFRLNKILQSETFKKQRPCYPGLLLLLNQTFSLWRNTSTRCRARQEHRHKLHHHERIPRSSMASSWSANAIVITHIISAQVIMFHITMARSPDQAASLESCCRTVPVRGLWNAHSYANHHSQTCVYSFSMLLQKRRVIKLQGSNADRALCTPRASDTGTNGSLSRRK